MNEKKHKNKNVYKNTMFLNLFLVSFIAYNRLINNSNFKTDHKTIYKT